MLRRRIVPALIVLALAMPASAADLTSGGWPAETRARLEARELATFPATAREVESGAGLVAGTLSPIAVHAGAEALRQGGTAADAAATVALTQVATNFGSVVSYAGVMQLVYFEAKTGRVYGLDAGWGTYQGETDPATIPATDLGAVTGQSAAGAGQSELGRQTLVPGFMAGIQALHDRFGRLPFNTLFQPSIWYAENGVKVSPLLGVYFQMRQATLRRTPEGRRFSSMPDGSLPRAGDVMRQSELAATLRRIAQKGAGEMHGGLWAEHYVAAVQAAGGRVTLEDLKRYRTQWREPDAVQFDGATVMGLAEANAGGCPSLEALNLLSQAHLDGMGPYWKDAQAFKAHVRALRFAIYGQFTAPAARFEAAHGFQPTCRSRTRPDYSAAAAQDLDALLGASAPVPEAGHHTDAVVVVDRWGNVAALVHSINTLVWGDTGLVVDGVPIADAAAINRARLPALKPGQMVPGDMAPLIVLRRGKPAMAVATVGASVIQENVRMVAGLLTGGRLMDLMQAPPLLLDTAPDLTHPLAGWVEPVPAKRYDQNFQADLASAGLNLHEEPPERVAALRGTAVVLTLDPSARTARTVEAPGVVDFAEPQ